VICATPAPGSQAGRSPMLLPAKLAPARHRPYNLRDAPHCVPFRGTADLDSLAGTGCVGAADVGCLPDGGYRHLGERQPRDGWSCGDAPSGAPGARQCGGTQLLRLPWRLRYRANGVRANRSHACCTLHSDCSPRRRDGDDQCARCSYRPRTTLPERPAALLADRVTSRRPRGAAPLSLPSDAASRPRRVITRLFPQRSCA
jgi:hypothetical protein